MQDSTQGLAIKDYVLKHTLPLVGHRKTSNDAKRYTRRPLVVVYYSVDFSFDYRAGEGLQGWPACGWALGTLPSGPCGLLVGVCFLFMASRSLPSVPCSYHFPFLFWQEGSLV